MAKWKLPARVVGQGGWFQIVITKTGHYGVDVTWFRNVPTQLDSYSNADPFGDSTAVLTFPQITGFDDPDASDLTTWFGLFSNVDIWWVPADPSADPSNPKWADPLTNQYTALAPKDGVAKTKLFEGFVSSIDFTADDTTNSVQLQCQGALFQLDRYLQKPRFPPRPIPLEQIIKSAFDHTEKPHLRTAPLTINWPSGWIKVVPPRNPSVNSAYVLDAKPGTNWSGYASRQTGSWERCLTGYIQDQLAVMLVQAGYGGHAGDQWTVIQQLQTANARGRVPVLQVRATDRTPDFSVWLGTPGITASFTRDGTQMANIAYGDGTSIDGTTWDGSVISSDGTRTDYQPLAWITNVYPYTHNKNFSTTPFVEEAYLKFGAGFEQDQATVSAYTQLRRDLDPGYTGSLTLAIDPTTELSRWTLRAGMTVKIFGLAGTGTDGVNFHISEVQCTPDNGTVELTIDSRYRDLLTVQEARQRTRDPLTPTRMLQVNRDSVMIQDLSAPWNYKKGSGFIPKDGVKFWAEKSPNTLFPYVAAFKNHPPSKHPYNSWYVKVNANASDRKSRWTRVPILTAEKATIRRTEIICLDVNGNILKNPFHASLWYVKATPLAMPRDKSGPSPYINNAFTTVDPTTGNPWPPGNFLAPEPGFIVGWGSKVNNIFNRAGFYPGAESAGSPVSGIFVDETTFSIDNTSGTNPNWNPNATSKQKQTADAVTIYAMFYAEYTEPVYFYGRMWRQEPGQS